MKTLKSIMLGLALLIIGGTVKAHTPPVNDNLTKTYAVNTYINAITRGKMDGLSDVLDKSVKFSMLRGNDVLSFDKKEMLDFMRKDRNVQQSCLTSTHVVESSNDIAMVRVDMQYDNFVRSNYVTIANTGAGWKITSVYSVFK
ncbi:nuclear transport factor 2 family protein [Mucilaginibacter glaciei]|uniref:Nuclear transport factor 2 family protein n=1 Tax=Mucilaginibacter glaciei TaxID=2772109 RepID=A0A926NPE0_9SPHI|nr:nuclear transport factor 2 family protein [Mucilaginibacter glaciei]MBD1392958.1 nuclear transport factor 2 family protein [Mucilaginibacter glaciei]